MGAEAEKTADPAKRSEARKRIGPHAAARSFERYMMGINPSFRLDAPRSDQKGIQSLQEMAQSKQEGKPIEAVEQGAKLIATTTYDYENRKVIHDFPDGSRIEEGPNGRIETPPPQSK